MNIDRNSLAKLRTETLLRGPGDYDRDTILALIEMCELLFREMEFKQLEDKSF